MKSDFKKHKKQEVLTEAAHYYIPLSIEAIEIHKHKDIFNKTRRNSTKKNQSNIRTKRINRIWVPVLTNMKTLPYKREEVMPRLGVSEPTNQETITLSRTHT